MAEPKKYQYDYPMPSLTVDLLIIKPTNEGFKLLLIKRGGEPFKGCWAFPGGFVNRGETLEEAARRELEEETSVKDGVDLCQFRAYGDPGRDPRGWVVSVVFTALVPASTEADHGDDAADHDWFKLNELPELAFDHQKIINEALSDATISLGQALTNAEWFQRQ